MSMLSILRIAAAILPLVNQVVDSVESVHSDKDGAKKKEIALNTTAILYKHTDPAVPFSDIIGAVGDLIDSAVATYNEAGTFVKSVKEVIN